MIASKPQGASPKTASANPDCSIPYPAREEKQPAQITKEYIWWCAVYHGVPLSADDPAFYHKAAILLAVMAGISLPEFVTEILNKTLPSVTSSLSEARREINEEIIRKLETVRRMASHASRRTFALLTAEVMTALYKIFHDVVASIPDEEIEKSMTDLTVNTWGHRTVKAPPEDAEIQKAVDTSSFAALGNPSMLPDTGSLWTVKPISIISKIPTPDPLPAISSTKEMPIPNSPLSVPYPPVSSAPLTVPNPPPPRIKRTFAPISETIADTVVTAPSPFSPAKVAPLSPTFMMSFTPTLTAALTRAGMVSPINATNRSASPPPTEVNLTAPPAMSMCNPTRTLQPQKPPLLSLPDRLIKKPGSNAEQKYIETQFTLKAVIDENSEVDNLCPVESSLFVMQEPVVDSVEVNKDNSSKEHFCKVKKGVRRVGRRMLKLVGSRPGSPVRCENCATPIKKFN
ncbi:hypothetical protein RvY_11017 [Ramazzottius varieornatus]|uniref:Uncharacterized protein n=1 Tax=Ramazzottius varieornatus TaxID=947166 RepID=A0A1D1VEP8_RAMVA|nr:hypothetical protein RvY_11017 [Ramazzottius varieornatus]